MKTANLLLKELTGQSIPMSDFQPSQKFRKDTSTISDRSDTIPSAESQQSKENKSDGDDKQTVIDSDSDSIASSTSVPKQTPDEVETIQQSEQLVEKVKI